MRQIYSFDNTKKKFIKSLIIGVISSVAFIIVLTCILSVIMLISSVLPYEYIDYIMLVIDAIGVLMGGYIAARINKSQGLYLGLLNGAVIFLALIISGLCVSNATLTVITLLKAFIILIFSAIGGIKGVNTKEKIRIK